MNILHDDVDLITDSLTSIAYTIWKALEHEDGLLYGHAAAGAAWILCGHLNDLTQRLKTQKAAGTDPAPEDPIT